MTYISTWERLSDAFKRVIATGRSDEQAKKDICGAIADRRIQVRVLADKRGNTSQRYIDLPPLLDPRVFNWQQSRFLNLWPGILHDDHWIELLRDDVTRVLCTTHDASSAKRSPPERQQRPRSKSRTARDRAQATINKIYPAGIPDQASEPNSVLCRKVGDALKEAGLVDVSDDTILRAAGRRK
jgi:hypothetical protein